MNKHPLTDDMRMYYNGTYVFREKDGRIEAMFVDGTTRDGDDRQMAGVVFQGNTWNSDGGLDEIQWHGDELLPVRIVSGYYDLDGKGVRNKYLTYSINNRSQRKGVDVRNFMVNGGGFNFSGHLLCRVVEQGGAMCSNPGYRDLFVGKEKVYWKGNFAGTIQKDGSFKAEKPFANFEDYVCQLLRSI